MTATETGIDWDVLNVPGVEEIVQTVASALLPNFENYLERDDLTQEGYILVACNGPRVRKLLAEGRVNYVANELYWDLFDKLRPGVKAHGALDFNAELI